MSRRPFLLLFGLLFILGCLCSAPAPRPTDYVAEDGGCFVPPKGDPVYDHFYANEVNPSNCESFGVQAEAFVSESQAQLIESQSELVQQQARAKKAETNLNMAGAGAIGFIFLFCVAVIIVGLVTR